MIDGMIRESMTGQLYIPTKKERRKMLLNRIQDSADRMHGAHARKMAHINELEQRQRDKEDEEIIRLKLVMLSRIRGVPIESLQYSDLFISEKLKMEIM